MYKQPSKRTQRIRLITLYSLMTVSVVAIVIILILVVSNYGFNRETGTLEQRGLVQFASVPSSAKVEVGTTTLSSRTSTKYSVEPGEHTFTMSKDGYEPWRLKTSVNAGNLVWLNYARLVPKDRSVQVINTYDAMTASFASPDSRSLLLQPSTSRPSFRLVDISGDTPSGKAIQIPSSLYDISAADGDAATLDTFTVESWDESGRYVLIWHTKADAKSLIVFDTKDPAKSVNVTREFSITVTQAKFSGRSGNILYVVSDGNLRKLDISGGTISRSFVSDIESFSLYDSNTITYTSRNDDDQTKIIRTVGVYREGDVSPTVLRTINDKDTSLSIASNSYYNTTYTVIAEGTKIDIYKGHYDDGIDGLELVTTQSLKVPIDAVEFNDVGSFVLVRAGTTFASYGLERQILSTNVLTAGHSKDLFWLDAMHLGLVAEGSLSMRDIDGTNTHTIMNAKSAQAVVFSRNGTYLYSFGAKKDTTSTQLQRVRMILK